MKAVHWKGLLQKLTISLFSRIQQYTCIYIAIYCVQFVYTCLSNDRHIHITHPALPMVHVPNGVRRTGSQLVNHVRWEWRPSQGAALWWRGAIILPAWIVLMFYYGLKKTMKKICPGCSVVISRWCFQIFCIFTLKFGEIIQFDSCFSNGLVQLPTRYDISSCSLEPLWVVQLSSCRCRTSQNFRSNQGIEHIFYCNMTLKNSLLYQGFKWSLCIAYSNRMGMILTQ